MIDREEFYHGVIAIRLIEDLNFQTIKMNEIGFVVNEEVLVFPKYSTKSSTPWNFSFSHIDLERLESYAGKYSKIIIALICGGDGVCALHYHELKSIVGNLVNGVSVKRKFRKLYSVTGPHGELEGKISLTRLQSLVFNKIEIRGEDNFGNAEHSGSSDCNN